MTTKLFSKRQTQDVLKQLRKEGYHVVKDSRGLYNAYMSKLPGDELVFTAMPGSRGYLVLYQEGLLQAA